MSFVRIITPVIIAISVLIVDYKFNFFKELKYTVTTIVSPILYVINYPYNIYNIFNIKSNNNEILLKQQVLSLGAKLQSYNALLLENKKLTNILNSNYLINNENYILTKITNLNKTRFSKYIIIDKGSSSGLKINNIVLGANGVIGKIIVVGKIYSTVALISDPLQYTPVINSRSGVTAIAKGLALNKDKMIIKFLADNSDVKVGDIFMSSTKGDIFSNKYPVGIVSEIIRDSQDFMSIVLKPIQKIDATYFAIINK